MTAFIIAAVSLGLLLLYGIGVELRRIRRAVVVGRKLSVEEAKARTIRTLLETGGPPRKP